MVRHHARVLFFAGVLALATVPVSIGLFSSTAQITPLEKENISQQKKSKVVIFDIGGVLFKTDLQAAFKHLGPKQLTSFSVLDWKSPHSLRPTLYKVAKKLCKEENSLVCDPYGDYVPFIFYEILKGTRSEQEALALVLEAIEGHEDFCSVREQNLCKKTAELMFDHKLLVSLQQEIKAGIKLFEECKKQGHHVIIFSNYSRRAFQELRNKFPYVFKGIPEENILVSAEIGSAKPEKGAYEALLQRFKQLGVTPTPSTCFFLDNQEENLRCCTAHGITGIMVKNQNFKPVTKLLTGHGILLKEREI